MPQPANGSGGVGANLAYTKFLFLCAGDDEAARTRVRSIAALLARGFLNDYDIDGAREAQGGETIQFLARVEGTPVEACSGPSVSAAPLAIQVSSKYRPRLRELEDELSRRVSGAFPVVVLEGAIRGPRYSSAEMQQHLQKHAPARRSGRISRNAIVMPIRKSAEWWSKTSLERHTYFYPHMDRAAGGPVAGHVQAANDGLPALYKRMYHNPDGYGRDGEYDFIAYFECDDDALPVFDRICAALRDPKQNPEWSFVEEGPQWRGRRVVRF